MGINLNLQNGKYTYVFQDDGQQYALRHGEQWRDLTGDNLTLALGQRIEALEKALKLAHSILLHEMDNGRTPTQLQGVGLGYFEDVIAGLDPQRS